MSDATPLTYISAGALAATAFPPRPFILEPILAAGSAGLVYGPAGVGKSFLALGLAVAAASGKSFLGWTAGRPHKVLYLDGEMGALELQRRLALFGPPPATLSFWLNDQNEGPRLDLASVDGIARLIGSWHRPELLVIDNRSCLAGITGLDPERGLELGHFMSERRRKGQAVLMVDQANREGATRGGGRRVDGMDLVMALRRPRGWHLRDGARFEIHIEKTRTGCALDPIVAQLCAGAQGAHWQWQGVRGPRIDEAVSLLRQGLGAEAMGRAIGVSRASAYRLQRRARQLGWIGNRKQGG
jgi:hypothetical protein